MDWKGIQIDLDSETAKDAQFCLEHDAREGRWSALQDCTGLEFPPGSTDQTRFLVVIEALNGAQAERDKALEMTRFAEEALAEAKDEAEGMRPYDEAFARLWDVANELQGDEVVPSVAESLLQDSARLGWAVWQLADTLSGGDFSQEEALAYVSDLMETGHRAKQQAAKRKAAARKRRQG